MTLVAGQSNLCVPQDQIAHDAASSGVAPARHTSSSQVNFAMTHGYASRPAQLDSVCRPRDSATGAPVAQRGTRVGAGGDSHHNCADERDRYRQVREGQSTHLVNL